MLERDLVLFLNRDVFFAAPLGNAVRTRGLRMRTVPDAARFAGVAAGPDGVPERGGEEDVTVEEEDEIAFEHTGECSS